VADISTFPREWVGIRHSLRRGSRFGPPAGLGNYTVGQGDKLVWRQREHGAAIGGVQFDTDEAATPNGGLGFDQNGQYPGSDESGREVWHFRVCDLSPQAGNHLMTLYIGAPQESGSGNWSIDFTDMFLYNAASGTWIPVLTDTHPVSMTYWSGSLAGGSTTDISWGMNNVPATSGVSERYYIDDHLGSTQMELSSGGWPVWSGQFTPFGQEIVAGQVLSGRVAHISTPLLRTGCPTSRF
jgi:hypothetical protein